VLLISQRGPEDLIGCNHFIIQPECIVELDPTVDCENIEIICGGTSGPEGCPCPE